MRISKDQKLISILLSGKPPKKYQGKEVVVFGSKVYILPENDKESGKFLNKLIKKFPKITPTLTFVPEQGTTYILTIFK